MHIKPCSDKSLLIEYQDEAAVIRDLLPGNYEPTPDQWLEIAAEIIRAVNRFRYLKFTENPNCCMCGGEYVMRCRSCGFTEEIDP